MSINSPFKVYCCAFRNKGVVTAIWSITKLSSLILIMLRLANKLSANSLLKIKTDKCQLNTLIQIVMPCLNET